MDCIDCHNRPSHLYRAPAQFVNAAMTAGRIPSTLPEIKMLAVQYSSRPYASVAAAREGIRNGITQFYRQSYPGLFAHSQALIEKGVVAIQDEYAQNIFPEMKVSWHAYPDNIGHLYFRGCFRCHNENHVSNTREPIRHDCVMCHDIGIQGTPGKGQEVARFGESLPFRHPVDMGGDWRDSPCTDCHAGGNP